MQLCILSAWDINDEGWINKKEPKKEEVEVVYKEHKAIRGPCEPDWPSSKALGC